MSKILLVEDNPDAVKRIIRYINKIFAELDVVSFPEAGDALQYAKANDISLFILDIQLEDYKGTNLAKQLRELPEYKYTPIIFETALAGEELSAYRDVKCYSFLVKPFGEEEFVTAFRDALGLSKQMSQQAKTIQIEQKQFILEYVTQDIAYIEAFGKKLVIHTSSRLSGIKEDTISGYTLSGLLALLDDPAFVQCHKSYAVNKSQSADGEAAPQSTAPPAPAGRRDSYILTVDAKDRIETEEERREVIWHEIKTSHIAGRILTGTLDGVEQTPSGRTIVVVDYKGYRIAIPLKEMMLYSGPVPYGAKYKPFMERMNSILATMLTAEIDFIVRGLDNTARSVVASRKAAMLRKRQTFYLDANEEGIPMIYEGRVVQARVIGVAEKVLRVEVFGVECTIFARDLSAAWFGDAREYYSVGDRVLVRVLTIDRSDINHISITADIRSVSSAANQSNLDKCVLQGKYAGRVTDVRHGVVFIRLNNGVNAVAHTCYDRRMPGKKDDVSFAVTRLDEERGIAVGIITRIIKQNL